METRFCDRGCHCLFKYGLDSLQFDKVVSFTSAINVNPEKVMKKIGMTKMGKFDHPKIEVNNILCKYVLCEIKNPKKRVRED